MARVQTDRSPWPTASSTVRDDTGFGLVEIVVSMFLLALLSLVFLPVLIQGLQISARNTTLATATQLVNRQIDLANAAAPDCDAVELLVGSFDEPDPRDVMIRVTTEVVGDCPTDIEDDDLFVTVNVTAERLDEPGATLSSASTLVFVVP